MKWSEKAWEAALPTYNEILEHPFIKELADGTLPEEKFRYYIGQDNLYINVYSRILAELASKLEREDDFTAFIGFAMDGIEVEKALHSLFVDAPGSTMGDACLLYTSYLKACAAEGVEIGCAAVLPCFWIYQKVGEHILSTAKIEGNPYAEWIKTYGDPAFDRSTRRAIAICDRLAEEASENTRRKMTEAFLRCSRMEWMFWDAAY